MHGGNNHTKFKPNHLSVMNYNFQTDGVRRDGQRAFDYQRFPLPALDESRLRPADGLGGAAFLQGYQTIFRGPDRRWRVVACHGPIDWNWNHFADTTPVAVDINGDTELEDLGATPNEWAQLVYYGGSIGSTLAVTAALQKATETSVRPPFKELTEQLNREIEPVDGP
jgi:hypothetical protein